jgi:pyruvate/2-oxoglutarate/acetoin dehydrogenase E1 component
VGKTLGETIREITRKHLEEDNGIILGQCLSAVGWVSNTIPNTKNIIELPMIDVAGAGIAVGTAITGRRPILVIRFQDFMFLNSSILVNYGAKAKELFNIDIPIFIRALANEKKGLGPVHSGVMHSIFMNVPGFLVCSPMTPKEYEEVWERFMKHKNPIYVSEHRHSFNQIEEIPNIIAPDADITIYGIGFSRFSIVKAIELLKKDGIKCNFINILWLKPLELSENMINPLRQTRLGLVVDSGFEIAGASQSIAYELMKKTNMYTYALGAEDKIVGVAERYENGTPSENKIVEKVKELIRLQKSS